MAFTAIFIKRPVLAIVISLVILIAGLSSFHLLPIMLFPHTENAVITVTTTYTGASPDLINTFITSTLEQSIAKSSGIDYISSSSTEGTSTININLLLNYDALRALPEITAQINSILNQLPKESQQPIVSVEVGETIDLMYIGFYSNEKTLSQITDYLTRVVQPRLQAIDGVKNAEIIGGETFALRAWLDPIKLAGLGISAANISDALNKNNVLTAVGQTHGIGFVQNLSSNTSLSTIDQFKRMVIKSKNGALVRLEDVAKVELGAQSYNSSAGLNGQTAVFLGIILNPSANPLSVLGAVKKIFQSIKAQLPQGLKADIIYDSSLFINESMKEVLYSLIGAVLIITLVLYFFLGSFRSVIIPLLTIPLSIIGTLFILLLFGYSINILTLLALVLAIGLVVDDAIIIVENIQRYLNAGASTIEAALLGSKELTRPILAITIVLIAIYLPIGFMGGLTSALFKEFAVTLAGSLTISALVALTLSPMLCSKLLSPESKNSSNRFALFVSHGFEKMQDRYKMLLSKSFSYLPLIIIFTLIILIGNYFLFIYSDMELAPQEDEGIILAAVAPPTNASLSQIHQYSNQVAAIFKKYPETAQVFQFDKMNESMVGMVLKPWKQRTRTSNQIQALLQEELNQIAGASVAVFQIPSLPSNSSGLPLQYVISANDTFERLNEVQERFLKSAQKSGLFSYLDSDLKLGKRQTKLEFDHDKVADLGLSMQDIGNMLSASLSENYTNYFNYAGRAYQVIPQMKHTAIRDAYQSLDYYIKLPSGIPIPLSTVATLKKEAVPNSLNHFQQLNSTTISAVLSPGVSMHEALSKLDGFAKKILPQGYYTDYLSQARQFSKEHSSLIFIFFLAILIIFLSLSALYESFRDPLIILISVPMSICGAITFISLGIGNATLNIYSEFGLITLIGLMSKHGILIVQYANDLQLKGVKKFSAIQKAATIRLRPILMTTAAMVLGVTPFLFATGPGSASRFNIGLVITSGISIGTLFTLLVVPSMYLLLAREHRV